MSLIKKIFIGNSKIIHNSEGAISRKVKNLKIIWNNEYHEDVGIERIMRLFLAASQFIFLGTYLRTIFGKTTF